MRRSTAIILWTVAAGFIAMCAIAFVEGAGCFAAALLDRPLDVPVGPLMMMLWRPLWPGQPGAWS